MPSAGRSVGAFDAAVPSVGSWFVQDVVRRVEHSAEQIKLIAQNLQGEPMGLVVVGDEVDHGDVAILAVTMATPDALRISWQIVVDDRVTELQVQPFCAGFRAYQDP